MLSEQTGCSSDSCSIFSVVWCGFTFVCHSWRQPDCSVPALGQTLARSWGMEVGRQSAGGARARGGAGDRVMPWGNKGPCEQFPDHKGGAVYPPWWGGGEGRFGKGSKWAEFWRVNRSLPAKRKDAWAGGQQPERSWLEFREQGHGSVQAATGLDGWCCWISRYIPSIYVLGGLWAIEFAFYPVAWLSQKVFCGNPSPTSLWGTKVERS